MLNNLRARKEFYMVLNFEQQCPASAMPPAKNFGQNKNSRADGKNRIRHSWNECGLPHPSEHLIPDTRRSGRRGRADRELPAGTEGNIGKRRISQIAQAAEIGMDGVFVACGKQTVRAESPEIRIQPVAVFRR